MGLIALDTSVSLATSRAGSDRPLTVLERSNRSASGMAFTDTALRTAISGSLPGGILVTTYGHAAPTAPGRQVGRYQLIERLGQGCQGEVWRAFPIGDDDAEDVALKVLPPAFARDPRRMAQFRHEAERGARIEGPALLPTFEYGESDGLLFMAMPLIDGGSLGDVVSWRRKPRAGGPPPPLHRLAFEAEGPYLRGIVRILAQVARGLARVHERGIVHRDIKPANILLDRRRDDEGYLCDFGLGRDLDIATPAQMRDGAGTPLYMAPERLLRRCADERLCDIFALGATLFEAVTLAPPSQIPDNLPWHSWHTHLAEALPSRPSAVRDGLPLDLDTIILKAIARVPEHRYPTADDLADDLDRFLTLD